MTRLDLPDNIHAALMKAARESGLTVEEWIATRLLGETNGRKTPTEAEIRAANERLEACIVDYGHPLGTDNDAIDEDMARAYGVAIGPPR